MKPKPPLFPSEWKRPDDEPMILKVMEGRGLYVGRMISGSKSGYTDHHPKNVAIFNANIVTQKGVKVWHGDLDLTVDAEKLKDIAAETDEVLYVLREMDARFGSEKEKASVLTAKAIWNTTQGVPKYDKDYNIKTE